MRVLVTGGAGFIGSHIVDRLVHDKHEVIVIDDESANNETFYWNDKSENYRADITNYGEIEGIFKNVDVVFHLAAESRLQPAILNPHRACSVNYMGTFNVLQSARENNVGRVIYSSTSSAYGLLNAPPLVEDMPPDCLNPYSSTKAAAEDLCRMYNKLYGLPTIMFRYFNVYGERMPSVGQYAPVMAIFLRQKARGEPLTVVGDGKQCRDFVHVKDVVEANIAAMKTDNEKCFGEIFNVGSGSHYSIVEIAKMISNDIMFAKERPGEALDNLSNIDKIKSMLGWYPSVKLHEWIWEIHDNN